MTDAPQQPEDDGPVELALASYKRPRLPRGGKIPPFQDKTKYSNILCLPVNKDTVALQSRVERLTEELGLGEFFRLACKERPLIPLTTSNKSQAEVALLRQIFATTRGQVIAPQFDGLATLIISRAGVHRPVTNMALENLATGGNREDFNRLSAVLSSPESRQQIIDALDGKFTHVVTHVAKNIARFIEQNPLPLIHAPRPRAASG